MFGCWFGLQPPLLFRYYVVVGGEVTFRDEPLGLKHLNGFLSSDTPSSGTFWRFSAASALLLSISSFILFFSSLKKMNGDLFFQKLHHCYRALQSCKHLPNFLRKHFYASQNSSVSYLKFNNVWLLIHHSVEESGKTARLCCFSGFSQWGPQIYCQIYCHLKTEKSTFLEMLQFSLPVSSCVILVLFLCPSNLALCQG